MRRTPFLKQVRCVFCVCLQFFFGSCELICLTQHGSTYLILFYVSLCISRHQPRGHSFIFSSSTAPRSSGPRKSRKFHFTCSLCHFYKLNFYEMDLKIFFSYLFINLESLKCLQSLSISL